MLTDTRQEKILSYLKSHVTSTVKELAAALYVSDATIRRDLTEMQRLGLLKRSHGGAILLEAADEISIFVRMAENAKEKEAAASKALPHLPTDFKTLFLDSSSTVLALAQRMDLSGKTVITNGLQTVLHLSHIRGINLIMPGGSLSTTGVSITGSWTNNQLAEFHYDLMLASCAAITGTGAYETSLDQREIKRTVFECSDRHILIADHTKLERTGAYLFQELAAFDMIVFDELTSDQRSRFAQLPVIC